MTALPEITSFGPIAAAAANRLRALAKDVETVAPDATTSLAFNLVELADPELRNLLWTAARTFARPGTPVVYIFRLHNPSIYPTLVEAFGTRPKQKAGSVKAYGYSRLNDPGTPGALYVGSSISLGSRISDHIGRTGSDTTFMMRLALWATGVDAEVELRLYRFPSSLDPLALESIEQQLWDEHPPLLGKRSGK